VVFVPVAQAGSAELVTNNNAPKAASERERNPCREQKLSEYSSDDARMASSSSLLARASLIMCIS
jgi:hypothetical protein